jgi:flagellar biosynthetic protein FliR
MALILESYEIVPIGAPLLWGMLIQSGIDAGGLMFSFAASIMLPIVAVLFIINLAIGIITKSAPQLNLFSVRFSNNNFQRVRIDHAFNFTICLGLFRLNRPQ